MSSLLINEFLTNCSNTCMVLDSFLWPIESWPDLERVEAVTILLDAVNVRCSDENRDNFSGKVRALLWERCMPLLRQISENGSHKNESGNKTLHALCRLLSSCLALLRDSGEVEKLTLIILPVFQNLEAEDGTQCKTQLDIDVAVEVLTILLPSLTSDPEFIVKLTSCILAAVRILSDERVSKILVRVLFGLLNCVSDRNRRDILHRILFDICSWHQGENNATATSRTLLCLTAVSDYLFPPREMSLLHDDHHNYLPDPRWSQSFWQIIQSGLTHRDNVARKRALYLLKKCVAHSEAENMEFASLESSDGDLKRHVSSEEMCFFRWTPSKSQVLQRFWQDYVLVIETLEENQIHVVLPVLNRVNTLIETTASDNKGAALVHPSWLLCVYQRMFHSENKAVMKEGVYHLLELRLLKCPDIALAYSQFIVGPFMDVLSESTLYHRSTNQLIGECPEVGLKLQEFFVNFFGSLPQENKGPVLLQLVQRLGSRHWCAVPLLFLSQALARLPPCPLLNPEGLLALREVLRCTMITHQVLLRGAAQCFLLHSALCLTDVQTVTLEEAFSFLVHFRPDESLCRGTALWKEVCDWLMNNEDKFRSTVGKSSTVTPQEVELTSVATEEASVEGYVQRRLEAFLTVPASAEPTDSLPDGGEADLLALAILLWADVAESRGGDGGNVQEALERLLLPLVDVLRRLSTSLYLPLRKSDKSLQLLLRLLQLRRRRTGAAGPESSAGDGVAAAVSALALSVVEPVQTFMARRLIGELQEVCDIERAGLYLAVLRELLQEFSGVPWYRGNMQQSFLPGVCAGSLRILSEPAEQAPSVHGQVQKAVAMSVLSLLCEVTASEAFHGSVSLDSFRDYFYLPEHLNQALLKPTATASDIDDSPLLRDWGRVAAQFICDQWACLSVLQRAAGPLRFPEAPGLRVALQAAVEALALLPSNLVLPVLDFMALLLPQMVLCEESLCAEAVALSWKVLQGLSGNANDFWPALQAFVRLAFHRTALELTPEQAPTLTSTIQQIGCELMELSEVKSGVFNTLISHCCHTWLPSNSGSAPGDDTCLSSTLTHLDILTEACLHGPVFRRDQRLIQEVQVYVEQLGDQCAANMVITSDNRDEQFPRVSALAFLSHLQPSSELQHTLMEKLVLQLVEKDRGISKSKARYYSNSLQHRIRNRVWQTLLFLLPKLRREFVVGTLLGYAFEAGFSSNQASVKYLIEWAMLLMLYHNPSHMDQFWACFSGDQEKTKTSICTFLSVLVHLDMLLPTLKDKTGQWRKALEVILQWCFSHNFSVRLYALLALKRVWGLEGPRAAAEEALGGADALGGLATVIQACLNQAEAMQNTGNAMKNWVRIQEHFFFSVFDPLIDYSVETIFYAFPHLSELADDEWIPPWKFEKMVVFSANSSLPVRNPVADLSQMQPGDWIQQDKGELEQEERWAEVQKKITAWRLSFQDQEPQLAAQQRALRLGKLTSALLVVASLIDKPTNLGGLCRTCEIFGASGLVLDSLRHVSDKQFQALSVSSELWLPLMEVKPVDLSGFLQGKKAEGYCIVGVEQTANSQSLQDYRFPEKSLLLLGNEREGIPANLLQLLDVCVEIPQRGITRSLNVHVSAALLVWEYTRQHIPPSN
ncbi:hypothetical protein AALO_G00232640 [Alosa alosa]|uniref:tRNA (guanosine(18)-2'-O)-methyltransferase TARBP1 n=1 Tax=Alosa alosa TaxID=278164 RepID=A0AAV6FYY6_9TELE|nr:probable methyltransferase TARBP1 isoform X1 [Alosa alosa]KAG5266487.1 hypothetical protein AALO_G00232640 [Alosa alosa]